jgi:hypothetical protein
MNPHVTNWTPGLLVLAAAIASAALFLLNARKGGTAGKAKSAPEDLEVRYQAQLAALRGHAAAKHLLPEAQWQAEQSRLESAAAAVLREKSGAKHEALKAQARAEKAAAVQAANPGTATLRGALLGGGVVAFFVVLGLVLTQQTKARDDGAGMTGGNPAMQGGRAPMQTAQDPQKEIDRLRKVAEGHPEDIEVLADVGAQMIKLQAFNDAFPIVTRASGIDPYHVPNRINRAVLDAVDGQALPAIEELEHLGETYQGAYKARLYAGLISLETEQPERALKQLEAYLIEAPESEQPPFVRMSVQQLRAQLQPQKGPVKAP